MNKFVFAIAILGIVVGCLVSCSKDDEPRYVTPPVENPQQGTIHSQWFCKLRSGVFQVCKVSYSQEALETMLAMQYGVSSTFQSDKALGLWASNEEMLRNYVTLSCKNDTIVDHPEEAGWVIDEVKYRTQCTLAIEHGKEYASIFEAQGFKASYKDGTVYEVEVSLDPPMCTVENYGKEPIASVDGRQRYIGTVVLTVSYSIKIGWDSWSPFNKRGSLRYELDCYTFEQS